jgi:hypothetical protein
MSKRWIGGALVAAWLSLAGPARAQQPSAPSPAPSPQMPAPVPYGLPSGPSPVPYGPPPSGPQTKLPYGPPPPPVGPPPGPSYGAAPNMMPGPLSPLAAPMGPPECMSLPANHPSAFQCEVPPPETGVYVNIGAMALQRQRLGSGVVAYLDPTLGQNRPGADIISNIVNGTLPDVRLRPLPGAGVGVQWNNLTPSMNFGSRYTFGYLFGNQSIEYTGFYIPTENNTFDTIRLGGYDALFHNAPVGFAGDWLAADRITMTQRTSLLNNELNYRTWNEGIGGIEVLVGVRYLRLHDTLSVTTDNDGLSLAHDNQLLAQLTRATYGVNAMNNIVAPQLGFEWTHSLLRWVSFSASGKGAWGANFIRSEVGLTRGDGYVGFDSVRHSTVFSQVYELGAFFDFHILDRLHLRAGYQTLWAVGIATSVDQVDFNLQGDRPAPAVTPLDIAQGIVNGNLVQVVQQGIISNAPARAASIQRSMNVQHGRHSDNGSLFFHGPMIELQFFF